MSNLSLIYLLSDLNLANYKIQIHGVKGYTPKKKKKYTLVNLLPQMLPNLNQPMGASAMVVPRKDPLPLQCMTMENLRMHNLTQIKR